MSVIIIGGGPRPNASIYTLSPVPTSAGDDAPCENKYAIMDGTECLLVCNRKSYAEALLPLIQKGE